ncbi:hypothetical protein Afe04nite_43940 [Asanoa ferruginea]|nr:hypothetical protein Afe04nite_43940 [Asanoa ferruginea]
MNAQRRLPALFARALATGAIVVGLAAAAFGGAFATSAASHFSAGGSTTSYISQMWHDL